MQVQRATGLLPSRAADNLFWVGRYVERAEATLRLIRAMINRVAEADEAAAPVIAGIGALLAAWNAVPDDTGSRAGRAHRARRARRAPTSTARCPISPARARSAASVIRDRFSPDAWRAINDLAIMIVHAACRRAPPKAPSPSASRRRCGSSRRCPGWRRRT